MSTPPKAKSADSKATAYIELGQERRDKIRRFCARIEAGGQKRPTLPEAVNQLLDKALELELATA